jgi:phospholipase D1/2
VWALAGALASALAVYGAGRALGRHAVRRLAGERLNRITRRHAKRGALTSAVLRLVPLASYSVVSAVAGASAVRLRDFALGTLIGVAPLVVIAFSLVDRARAAYFEPGPVSWAFLAASIGIVAAGGFLVWRRFGSSGE